MPWSPSTGSPVGSRSNRGDGDRAAGFTLLETTVALAIVAVALAVLLDQAALALRTRVRAEAVTEATLVARSRLAEIGVSLPMPAGTSGGRLPDGTRWRLIVRPLPAPGASGVRPMAVGLAVIDDRGVPLASLDTVRLATVP